MIRSASLVGLLLLLGGIAYVTAELLYFVPESRAQVEIAELSGTLADYGLRLHSAKAELTLVGAPPTGSNEIVRPGSEVDSAPWLQSTIRQAVAAAGGVAATSQTGSTPINGNFTKLSLLLRASFSEAGLLTFLRQVESDEPPLVVEDLSASPTNVGNGQLQIDVTATIFVILSNAPAV